MAGRGSATFNKRKKEAERKERQESKMQKRLQRRDARRNGESPSPDDDVSEMTADAPEMAAENPTDAPASS